MRSVLWFLILCSPAFAAGQADITEDTVTPLSWVHDLGEEGLATFNWPQGQLRASLITYMLPLMDGGSDRARAAQVASELLDGGEGPLLRLNAMAPARALGQSNLLRHGKIIRVGQRSVWRLLFQVDGVAALAPTFEQLHLPQGASLFCYSPDGQFLSHYGSSANQEDAWLDAVPGSAIVLELNVATKDLASVRLQLQGFSLAVEGHSNTGASFLEPVVSGSSRKAALASGDAGYGSAVASGDFNGDGFEDVAVGAPGEADDSTSASHPGAVHILYGGANRLTETGRTRWIQSAETFPNGKPENDDAFGAALAAGDFNGDGYADLAIGAPGEGLYSSSRGQQTRAGSVNIIYGSAGGISLDLPRVTFYQSLSSTPGISETDDAMGSTLTTGDFNNDGFDDLAIGIPGEDVGSLVDAGLVLVIEGSAGGLAQTQSYREWHQAKSGVKSIAYAGEAFGTALASTDVNNDGYDDLAIGVPQELLPIGGVEPLLPAGCIHLLKGAATGLTSALDELWHKDSTGILGTAAEGDAFGASLAGFDINGDGYGDLVVGAPGADYYIADSGQGHLIFGGSSGMVTTNNRVYNQEFDRFGPPESNDGFASVLAAGDFNNDGRGDVIFGVPMEDEDNFDAPVDSGTINMRYGLSAGTGNPWTHTQNRELMPGSAMEGHRFGAALATGDFNGDGRDDLAVGVPGHRMKFNTPYRDGAVVIIYSGGAVLYGTNSRIFSLEPIVDIQSPSSDGSVPLPQEDPGTPLPLSSPGDMPQPSICDDADYELAGPAGAGITHHGALADLDGDGDLDFYNASRDFNAIYLNDGLGNFTTTGQYINVGYSPAGLRLADLDGDGDTDAFVANYGGARPTIWINDGDGWFRENGQQLFLAYVGGVALGDVDGDGDYDAFVVSQSFNSTGKLYYNNGKGQFYDSGQTFPVAPSNGADLHDLDEDGDLDLTIYSSEGNVVLFNDGTGFFSAGGSISLRTIGDNGLDNYQAHRMGENTGMARIASASKSGDDQGNRFVGDLDGDGDLDVIIGTTGEGDGNMGRPNCVWLNTCDPNL